MATISNGFAQGVAWLTQPAGSMALTILAATAIAFQWIVFVHASGNLTTRFGFMGLLFLNFSLFTLFSLNYVQNNIYPASIAAKAAFLATLQQKNIMMLPGA